MKNGNELVDDITEVVSIFTLDPGGSLHSMTMKDMIIANC